MENYRQSVLSIKFFSSQSQLSGHVSNQPSKNQGSFKMKPLKLISIFIAIVVISYLVYSQIIQISLTKDPHAGHNHQAGETSHTPEDPENKDDAFAGWSDLSEKVPPVSDENIIEITKAQQKEIGLTLAKAGTGYLYNELTVPGEVVLNQDSVIHLFPRVSGITLGVYKTLGDKVKKGEVMAILDSAELAEAKSKYYELYTEVRCCLIDLERAVIIEKNTTRAIKDLLKFPSLSELKNNKYGDMGKFRSELLATYSTFITSKNDYDRNRQLYAKKVVSESTYSKERNRLDKAQADFYAKLHDAQFKIKQTLSEAQQLQQVTEFKLRTAKRRLMIFGLSKQQISKLHHSVSLPAMNSPAKDCDDTNCTSCSKVDVSKTTKSVPTTQDEDETFSQYIITSPQAGTVISKHISRGEKITSENEVFTIADLSKVWVNLKVAGRDIARIKKNMQIIISSDSGLRAEAKIELVAPTIDEETRTVTVRVIIDNHNRQWKPGMFVTGHIRLFSPQIRLVVPADAVQNIEGKNFIFIPVGAGFNPVQVITGKRDRKKVEIISGIKSGERYVDHGAFDLKAIKITSGQGSHAGHNH